MKKALIEPNGRVAQVEPINTNTDSKGIPFLIALPFVWVDCPDNIEADKYTYSARTGLFTVVK